MYSVFLSRKAAFVVAFFYYSFYVVLLSSFSADCERASFLGYIILASFDYTLFTPNYSFSFRYCSYLRRFYSSYAYFFCLSPSDRFVRKDIYLFLCFCLSSFCDSDIWFTLGRLSVWRCFLGAESGTWSISLLLSLAFSFSLASLTL